MHPHQKVPGIYKWTLAWQSLQLVSLTVAFLQKFPSLNYDFKKFINNLITSTYPKALLYGSRKIG